MRCALKRYAGDVLLYAVMLGDMADSAILLLCLAREGEAAPPYAAAATPRVAAAFDGAARYFFATLRDAAITAHIRAARHGAHIVMLQLRHIR